MMRYSLASRNGITLVEVLVVIAILGVLFGLLLTAIQRVREVAALALNKNNLRQIILSVHQLADQNGGRINDLTRSSMQGVITYPADTALFHRLLPFVHGPRNFPTDGSTEAVVGFLSPEVKVYRNPADSSWDFLTAFANSPGKCSYALNLCAADGEIRLTASIPDGVSQTVALADTYAIKGPNDGVIITVRNSYTHATDPLDGELSGTRRATFADAGWRDVLPVAVPGPGARASVPGKTFQVRPRPEEVDPSIPQTPHRAGLTVALFDGSVRTVSPSVSEAVFWALVTPAGGEVAGLD